MSRADRELTKAELQIMQELWDMDGGFVHEIIERLAEPRPAYNTVSTIVRILEKKGFVDHEAFGKSHRYFPLVTKEEYTGTYMNSVLSNFFDNSVSRMVSFFTQREKISLEEMNQIMNILNGEQGSAKGEE